jgi:integrase
MQKPVPTLRPPPGASAGRWRRSPGLKAARVPTRPAGAPADRLADVFARYYAHHAKNTRSGGSNRRNLFLMLTTLPEGITVGELTLDKQQQASIALHRTFAPGTVKRCFAIAKAAVQWAWNNGELDRPMPFLAIPEGAGRERILSVAELARLWSADMPDHVRTFLALLIGTGARPEALL